MIQMCTIRICFSKRFNILFRLSSRYGKTTSYEYKHVEDPQFNGIPPGCYERERIAIQLLLFTPHTQPDLAHYHF